ncbi:hypothetical protein M432DRAFT_84014 [Thermoascus aurantiacus ATCC 26904]
MVRLRLWTIGLSLVIKMRGFPLPIITTRSLQPLLCQDIPPSRSPELHGYTKVIWDMEHRVWLLQSLEFGNSIFCRLL